MRFPLRFPLGPLHRLGKYLPSTYRADVGSSWPDGGNAPKDFEFFETLEDLGNLTLEQATDRKSTV